MNYLSNKRPLEEDDHCSDEWDTPQKLTDAHGAKSRKMMRHVMAQPLSEQGWGRCQAGFDGVSFKEEEKVGRSYKKRSRGRKRMSLDSSVLDDDQESSLDIDWSSSSDSLSDVEPLPPDTARSSSKRPSQKRKISQSSRRRSNPGLLGSKVKSGRREMSAEGEDVEIEEEEEEQKEERGAEDSWVMKDTSPTSKSQTSQSEDKKSTQIDISDYDSPSEDQTCTSPLQVSSSLCISDQSPTPQPPPDESPTKDSPQTGSVLLKKLKLPAKTPDKEGSTRGPSGGNDSAKKRRKFIRGGLAEGLQRVINREKSASAFWSHRTVDDTTAQSQRLDLRVLSLEEVRGLFITRCQLQPSTSEVTDEEMFVLFTEANGRQLKLGVGSRVRVHPPWQKLILPNYKQPVILCTYFCLSLEDADTEMPSTSTNQLSYENVMSSGSLGMQLKPTRLFLNDSSQTQTRPAESTLQSVPPHPTEASNSHVSDSFLDSIAQSGAYSTVGMCVRAMVHRVYCRGCNTEAKSLSSMKNPEAGNCPEESAKQPTQWALLLQDKYGIFCELLVMIGGTVKEEDWRQCLRKGEGNTMVFAGLKVMRRVNRTRSPGLFSLIDSLWVPGDGTPSQSETESQDCRSQGLVSPQSFCYILGVQTLRNTIRKDPPDRVKIPYKEPVIHTLREVQEMSDTSNQRVTVFAKVIHGHQETGAQDVSLQSPQAASYSVWHLFLTDHSLSRESVAEKEKESEIATGALHSDSSPGTSESQGIRLVHVHVRASCNLTECVKEWLMVPGSLVLLRDLCLDHDHHLYADTYTTIQRLTRDSSMLSEMELVGACIPKADVISRLSQAPIPPLPLFCLQSSENSLVSVSGVVTGVDEATAYSWPACDTCGNNKLEANHSSSQLHCGTCQRHVTSPLTKMHLELFIHCPSVEEQDTVVKVQLLQSSIEQVLPPLSSQEEGYDLQCIMGVTFGPVSCFLKTVTRRPGEPATFDLEEVSLELGT